MKWFVRSLMFRIIVLCTGLVLVSVLALHYFSFRSARSSIEYTLGQMAINITGSVNKIIDTDKYADLAERQDIKNEYYGQLKKDMIAMKNNTGLKYLYTISKTADGQYIYVVDGTEAGAEGESVLGDKEEEISDAMTACFNGKESYEFYDSEEWGQLISGYVPIVNKSGMVVGILGADFDANYMIKQLNQADMNIYLAGGFTLLFSIILAVAVSYWIVRSLKELQSKIDLVKDGDLTLELKTKNTDEIGKLSESFQAMILNMSFMIKNIRSHSEIAMQSVDSLNGSIEITCNTTEEISKIAGKIAAGAEMQALSIEDVENSVRSVFKEVGLIKENIAQADKESDLAVADMQEAAEKLDSTAIQIDHINDTIDMAAGVIKELEIKFKGVLEFSTIISSLARKTNLLALNASIEAASAGQHGKGFAVVAEEIKSLAAQSNDASLKINELVTAVQKEIDTTGLTIESGVLEARDGVKDMSSVKEYLTSLSDSNSKTNLRIKDISTAILLIEEESARVLEKAEALSGIAKDLRKGTQDTSAQTQEQNAILEEIKNDLADMKTVMKEMGGSVNKFKVKE